MTPLNLIASPLIFGFRTVSRVTQFAADGLEHLVGRGQSDSEARPRSPARPKPLDDVSITRKVETEIFRDPKVPKGAIDVNTADGVVWIRGEAKTPDMINELERRANEIPEVKHVENLLHLPKTPAPSRADAPRRQQKTRRSKPRQNKRPTTRRVTSEKASRSTGEPTPRQVARDHRGRPPAPLTDGESRTDEDAKKTASGLRDRQTTRADGREEQSPGEETRNPTQVELDSPGEETRNPTQVELDRANAEIREHSAVRETEKSQHLS